MGDSTVLNQDSSLPSGEVVRAGAKGWDMRHVALMLVLLLAACENSESFEVRAAKQKKACEQMGAEPVATKSSDGYVIAYKCKATK